MTKTVEIVEVGPRDGLQNEPREIPVAEKIALIDLLSLAGFKRIEAASFVSPKWVPQMAGSPEVMSGITRRDGVRFMGLTPNLKGYNAAIESDVDEIAIFASASEGFSQANLNTSIAESLARFEKVAEAALSDGMPVRGYVSCVVECPFDGNVEPEAVARVCEALDGMGVYEISLGDTIGKGAPKAIGHMFDAVLDRIPSIRLAGHFHDTSGQALANIDVALEKGIRVFDASVGGLGGCPYAPGASGNVATETVHAHLESLGFATGLDFAILKEAANMARKMRNG